MKCEYCEDEAEYELSTPHDFSFGGYRHHWKSIVARICKKELRMFPLQHYRIEKLEVENEHAKP